MNKIMEFILSEMNGTNSQDYKECDNCNGYGSSLKENSHTCTKCGGEGVIHAKRQEI